MSPALVAVVLALALAGCGGSNDTASGGEGLVARHLYMGVTCGTGNEVGCDRVALSVEVPSNPDYVTALVAGHRVRLSEIDDGYRRAPFIYQGALEPDGLLKRGSLAVDAEPDGHWSGSPAVRVPVTLRAVYRHDRIAARRFGDVRLMPGFG